MSRALPHIVLPLALLFTALIAGVPSHAQPMFYFKNIDAAQGLPNNSVSAFCEDNEGYLWVGTKDGLVRYDGVTMETFFHDPEDSTSLGSNAIGWDVVEDARGDLWIALHEHGLSRLDRRTGVFTNFSFANGKFPHKWMDHVVRININASGTAYISCHDGLFKVEGDSVTILSDLRIAPPALGPGKLRFAILTDDRWLWITSTRGLKCYDTRTGRWQSPASGDVMGPSSLFPHLECHGASAHGDLLAFGSFHPPTGSLVRYLYLFDLRSFALDSVPIAPEVQRQGPFAGLTASVLVHSDGTIYVGTSALGLLEYDPESGTWKQHQGGRNWSSTLLPGPITRLYEDGHQRIWIGTESGISLLATDHQLFRNFDEVRTPTGKSIELTGIGRVVAGANGDLWVGKRNEGLLHLDSAKHLLAQYSAISGSDNKHSGFIDPTAMVGDTLICHVWYDGLFGMDVRTGKVSRLDDHRSSGEPELRNAFAPGSGGLFAFGWSRFGRLDLGSGAFRSIRTPALESGRWDLAWNATEDQEGMLWYGTEYSGMVRLDPKDLRTIGGWVQAPHISPTTKVPDLLHNKGRIFFSLHGEGMGVLNVADNAVSFLTKKDGLCSDHINGFVNDADNDLWIYSSSGISWYNEVQGTFRNFRGSDGMLSQLIHHATLLPNGHILLVSDRGFIEFDPKELKHDLQVGYPVIRSVQVLDQELGPEAWSKGTALEIPHDRNYLRVEFTALEFFDPERIDFAYRMDGATHWNHTTGAPVAIYSDLAGGAHELCIKRSDLDGVWGPELCIPLFVTTPFYQKPWFLGLAVLLVIIVGVFLYRWQLAKKMALVQVRDRLSRDLHDDVGSALSSINIFSQVARQRLDDDKEKTRELLGRIGSSASTMMRNMDDLIWTLDPDNDRVGQLVARMRDLALPVLDAKDIACDFVVDPAITDVKLDMVLRRSLFLVFKEALNNLAKYSEARHARIELQGTGTSVRLSVTDDGVGFDPTAINGRHGLKNMQARAREIGGEATIVSSLGRGTTVSVTLPLT